VHVCVLFLQSIRSSKPEVKREKEGGQLLLSSSTTSAPGLSGVSTPNLGSAFPPGAVMQHLAAAPPLGMPSFHSGNNNNNNHSVSNLHSGSTALSGLSSVLPLLPVGPPLKPPKKASTKRVSKSSAGVAAAAAAAAAVAAAAMHSPGLDPAMLAQLPYLMHTLTPQQWEELSKFTQAVNGAAGVAAAAAAAAAGAATGGGGGVAGGGSGDTPSTPNQMLTFPSTSYFPVSSTGVPSSSSLPAAPHSLHSYGAAGLQSYPPSSGSVALQQQQQQQQQQQPPPQSRMQPPPSNSSMMHSR
jgi:hypothetical protein